ncbi:hypothetical protein SDJN03_28899, partial [Cucurbita argyrosperma subsp. sororia]
MMGAVRSSNLWVPLTWKTGRVQLWEAFIERLFCIAPSARSTVSIMSWSFLREWPTFLIVWEADLVIHVASISFSE